MQVLPDPAPLRLSKIIPAGTPSVLLCDQNLRTLRYPVEVNDQLMAGLVDTGASISFIRRSLVEEMQLPVRPRQPLVIGFANKQATATCQEVRVWLSIAGKRQRWAFAILDLTAEPLILGVDAVEAWGLVIDPCSLELYVLGASSKTRYQGRFSSSRGRQGRPQENMWEIGDAQLQLMQADVEQDTVDDSRWTEPRVLHSGLVNNIFRIKGCGKTGAENRR